MHDMKKDEPRAVIVAIDNDDGDINLSLAELRELAKTAGIEVVGELVQKRERKHPGTYLGKGKVEELKAYADSLNATGILCDDELSSTQIKNLSETLNLTILDRTMIILDIFANRAITSEGKAQVELAQLKYRSSRLIGLGKQLSRQGGTAGGGGIGARGPGEKKLETDRRHIQSRIKQLNKELNDIKTTRDVLRSRRKQQNIPVISLVGYTNAGKSTLMNTLTKADVLAEDKLFATLDTTTRKIRLPSGKNALLTDTVGFIDKLPHHLIQAFRATLEELRYSTVLLHVVDISDPEHHNQTDVVYSTLKDLKCLDKPLITAFNKSDLIDLNNFEGLCISAKTGLNLSALLEAIDKHIETAGLSNN